VAALADDRDVVRDQLGGPAQTCPRQVFGLGEFGEGDLLGRDLHPFDP
jgi:hypothetical protein